MRVHPPLPSLALPAWANQAALPAAGVDWSELMGFRLVAPAGFAGLGRARMRT